MMNKRKIRDYLRLTGSFVFFIVYLPHLLLVSVIESKKMVYSDVSAMTRTLDIKLKGWVALLYFLHNNAFSVLVLFQNRPNSVFADWMVSTGR